MFMDFLAKLNTIGQASIVTQEDFISIQRIRSDILTAYTEGSLSDFEKCHLMGISAIIMNEMRKDLIMSDFDGDLIAVIPIIHRKEPINGTEKNQDGTDGHPEL